MVKTINKLLSSAFRLGFIVCSVFTVRQPVAIVAFSTFHLFSLSWPSDVTPSSGDASKLIDRFLRLSVYRGVRVQ